MRPIGLFLGLTVVLALSQAKPLLLENDESEELGNAWEKSGEFEGDIMTKPSTTRNGLVKDDYRWPNATLVYKIDKEFDEDHINAIKDAIEEYNTKTCIRMRPKTAEDTDYVFITGQNAQGCSSYVGRQGGKQLLKLKPGEAGKGCFRKGTIVHELLHALGFYHQQSSTERDEYVKIVWENIAPGREHNFKKYDTDTVTNYNVTYDYDSVMHYSAYAFSKNKEKTIVPLDDNASIGQREGMSLKDIGKLHFMYNCSEKNIQGVDTSNVIDKSYERDIDNLETLFLQQN